MGTKEENVTTIELREEEREFLLELFASAERQLLRELDHTDTRQYRTKLEDRLSLLAQVKGKITHG